MIMEVFLPTNPLSKSLGDVEEPPLDFNKTSRPKIANKAVDENDIALFLSNWKRRQLYLHFPIDVSRVHCVQIF